MIMQKTKKLRFILGLALLALATSITPSQATGNVDLTNPAFAAASGRTSIPIGHAEFCQTRPEECTYNSNVIDYTVLTEGLWRELLEVNASYNASIVPVTDKEFYGVEEFWTYPRGYGDCEEYVLAKRRELIQRGWNPSTLLITVLVSPKFGGHAILMARTDRGDFVLDNMEGLVKVWNQTPYQFIKRQSQSNAGQWVDLVDTRPLSVLASL
jgi:predicted transglutaminase-like cysteine proteinase